MAKANLEVEERTASGTTACRRLRRSGYVPGNVYGLDRPPFPVQMVPQRIEEILRLRSGQNTILALQMANRDVKADVLMRDLQRDPVTDAVIHVDFVRIDPTQPIEISVPIHLKGTPLGVKNEGGLLDFIHRELVVSCLPDRIPEEVGVDVSELHLNQHVSVSDLNLGEGIVIEDDPNQVIATVSAPRVEEEPTAEEEEAEAAEKAEGEEGEAAEKKEGESGDKKDAG